jgi:peptidoglycan hydrolase CwlO-like protein
VQELQRINGTKHDRERFVYRGTGPIIFVTKRRLNGQIMEAEFTQFLQEVLQQYGIWGLIIGFLITGPGFTYLRTKNVRLQAETHAQQLIQQVMKREQKRSDRLEGMVNTTQSKLDAAEARVTELTIELATALRQVKELKRQINELQGVVKNE